MVSDNLTAEKDALLAINDDLNIRLEKVINLKTLQQHNHKVLPYIYAITPTYRRFEQKAELTRYLIIINKFLNEFFIYVCFNLEYHKL